MGSKAGLSAKANKKIGNRIWDHIQCWWEQWWVKVGLWIHVGVLLGVVVLVGGLELTLQVFPVWKLEKNFQTRVYWRYIQIVSSVGLEQFRVQFGVLGLCL
jgi:hypothetical protein